MNPVDKGKGCEKFATTENGNELGEPILSIIDQGSNGLMHFCKEIRQCCLGGLRI